MFLEERLPACVRLGASWSEEYDVIVTRTASSAEYRQLVQPFPVRRFSVSYVRDDKDELYDQIVALYHRVYGKFAGFRVRSHDDYSSNGNTGTPGIADQELQVITPGSVYQLQKEYGAGGSELSIGLPVRTIFKPVAGTILLSIRNATTGDNVTTGASVDTTTGQVTMDANKTRSITAITPGATTLIGVGVGHSYVIGDSVHISGVSGMTQINGRRAAVTMIGASTITVAINSTGFSAYTSGGTVNTRPQSGETVRGGFEFDIPARFDSTFDVTPLTPNVRETGTIELVELLNP
jgi:uncharacterized protein (TIGR02217 family)